MRRQPRAEMQRFTLDSDIDESPAKPSTSDYSKPVRFQEIRAATSRPLQSRLSIPKEVLGLCHSEDATPHSSVLASQGSGLGPAQGRSARPATLGTAQSLGRKIAPESVGKIAEQSPALPISRARQTSNASYEYASLNGADDLPVATAAGSQQCKERDEGVVYIADELGYSHSPRLPADRLQEVSHDGDKKEQATSCHADPCNRDNQPTALKDQNPTVGRPYSRPEHLHSSTKLQEKVTGDFFLTSGQRKRRRLEEVKEAADLDAKSAKEKAHTALKLLLAEKGQRAQEKAILAGRKPHPFMQPRSASAATMNSRPSKPTQTKLLQLQPCIPPLHITQLKGSMSARQSYRCWAPAHLKPCITPATVSEQATYAPCAVSDIWMSAVQPQDSRQIAAVHSRVVNVAEPARVADNTCNALWTQKYRPICAAEVCGNEQAVDEMLSWLQNWHEAAHPQDTATRTHASASDSENEYSRRSQSSDWDSDAEMPGTKQACNAIWLSGPTGCGKSAAIAAVAQDLGYLILEVNPGMERTGANVMRNVGEATQSNRMLSSATSLLLGSGSTTGSSTQGLPCSSNGTLLVFEEVDSLAEEDRGYLSALCSLIQNSKRPIILTAHSSHPPASLEAVCLHQIAFDRLSDEQIRSCLSRIFTAEQLTASDHLLDTLTALSQGDLRKAMLEAQLSKRETVSMGAACSDLEYLEDALLLSKSDEREIPASPYVKPCRQQACKAQTAPGTSVLTDVYRQAVLLDVMSSLDTLQTLDGTVDTAGAEYELSDDLQWQCMEGSSGLHPLPEEYIAHMAQLLRGIVKAPLTSPLPESQQPVHSGALLRGIFELLCDAASREQTGSWEGRAVCARSIVCIASLEEGRRRDVMDLDANPHRRRRRGFLHYLEEDVGMTEHAIHTAMCLQSWPMCFNANAVTVR